MRLLIIENINNSLIMFVFVYKPIIAIAKYTASVKLLNGGNMYILSKIVFISIMIVLPGIIYGAERAGIATLIEGDVWLLRSNIEYTIIDGDVDIIKQRLVPADIIYANDTIITNKNGKAELLFDDNTILSITGDSQVSIDEFIYNPLQNIEPSFIVRIVDGVTRVISGKIVEQNPDKFKIKAPLANIGIRGTMTVHSVIDGSEKHYIIELGNGHEVLVGSTNSVNSIVLKESGYYIAVDSDKIPDVATKASDSEIEDMLIMTSVKGKNSDLTFNADLLRPDYSNILRTIHERGQNAIFMPMDRGFVNQNRFIK